jgi:predicted HTH domain antitoxin
MTTLTLQLPDEILSTLRQSPDELAMELRLAAAIHWYQQSRISQERAAQFAGLSRRELLAELARRKIDVFVVDPDDLKRELERE